MHQLVPWTASNECHYDCALLTGRSVSLNSQPLSQSADFGELCVYSPRLTPIQRAPLEREITCVSLQNEGISNKSVVLDLGKIFLCLSLIL